MNFLLVTNSNLGFISHRLATDKTDRRTTTVTLARPLLKYSRLKIGQWFTEPYLQGVPKNGYPILFLG